MKSWFFRLRWYLLGAIVLYLAVGFFILPPILKAQIPKQVAKNLGVVADLKEVKVNPLTLSVTLADFDLRTREQIPLLGFDRLYLNAELRSILRFAAIFKEIRLEKPRVNVVVGPDGKVNLFELLPKEEAGTAQSSGLPRAIVKRLAISSGAIDFEDRVPEEPFRLELSPIDFSLNDFSTLKNRSGAYELAARSEGGESFRWNGTVGVDPPVSTGRFELTGIALEKLNAYLPADLPFRVEQGTIGLSGDYTVSLPPRKVEFALSSSRVDLKELTVAEKTIGPLSPLNLLVSEIGVKSTLDYAGGVVDLTTEVTARINDTGSLTTKVRRRPAQGRVEGSLKIADLPIAPAQPAADLFSFAGIDSGTLSAEFRGVQLKQGEKSVTTAAGSAALKGVRISDRRDRSPVLDLAEVSAEGIEYTDAVPRLSVGRLKVAGARIHAVRSGETINLRTLARESAEESKGEKAPVKPLSIRVGEVLLAENGLTLTDKTPDPVVALEVSKFSGRVRGLSSEPASRASVDLRAVVQRVAPLTLKGRVNPLAPEAFADLTASFTGFDLTTLSPYFGQFLGYKLDKGKLKFDLKYDVQKRAMKGNNRVIVDQFTLGETVDSPDATSLPVKLGLAILKDSDGVIDLDVPVEGKLDDPEFRLGKVIWRAIGNVLVKAVTSPFAFLTGGGGEDADAVVFEPGSGILSDAEKGKLAKAVSAMRKRPALTLEVRGGVSPAADRAGLGKRAIYAKLRGRGDEEMATPLSPKEEKKVRSIYEDLTGKKPGESQSVTELLDEVSPRYPVPDEAMALLAQERGKGIQENLLAAGLSPERLFLLAPDMELKGEGESVKIPLALKTRP